VESKEIVFSPLFPAPTAGEYPHISETWTGQEFPVSASAPVLLIQLIGAWRAAREFQVRFLASRSPVYETLTCHR